MPKRFVGFILVGLILATMVVEARIRLQPEPLGKILVITDQRRYSLGEPVGITIKNVGKIILDEYVVHLQIFNAETGQVLWRHTFFTEKLVKPGDEVFLSLDLGRVGVKTPGVYTIHVLLGRLYASTKIVVEAVKPAEKLVPTLEEPVKEVSPEVTPSGIIEEFQVPKRVVLGQTTTFSARIKNPGNKTIITTLKIDLPGFSPEKYSREVVIGPGEEKQVVFEAVPRVLGDTKVVLTLGTGVSASLGVSIVRGVPHLSVNKLRINPPDPYVGETTWLLLEIINDGEAEAENVVAEITPSGSVEVLSDKRLIYSSISPNQVEVVRFELRPRFVGETSVGRIVLRYQDGVGNSYEEIVEQEELKLKVGETIGETAPEAEKVEKLVKPGGLLGAMEKINLIVVVVLIIVLVTLSWIALRRHREKPGGELGGELPSRRQELTERREELRRLIDNLKERYEKGEITTERYRELQSEYERKLEEVIRELLLLERIDTLEQEQAKSGGSTPNQHRT